VLAAVRFGCRHNRRTGSGRRSACDRFLTVARGGLGGDPGDLVVDQFSGAALTVRGALCSSESRCLDTPAPTWTCSAARRSVRAAPVDALDRPERAHRIGDVGDPANAEPADRRPISASVARISTCTGSLAALNCAAIM
jgi:hypothetical protein